MGRIRNAHGTPLCLRNATIVDGSGSRRRRGDLLVHDGRIAEVGDANGFTTSGATELDLSGLVLAPGFIDIHTHYDAQVLWDRDLTPSSWHGVTTVVTGNCGFSIAPVTVDGRRAIMGTLEQVEDMAPEALQQGIAWDFGTFPEYLDLLEHLPKRLNVAAMIGHTALRLYVLGEEALDRQSTDAEIATMKRVVHGALTAGAVGFATSRSRSHTGHLGRPVASRLADVEELLGLVEAVDQSGRGVVQIAAGDGLDEVAQLAARTARPITWSALLTGRYSPQSAVDMVDATGELSGDVWPQISCRPLVVQITLAEPRALVTLGSFAELMALPLAERSGWYRDPAWRSQARNEVHARWGSRWGSAMIDDSPSDPDLNDRPLAEVAAEQGMDPFDCMVDISLADDLRSRFTLALMNDDEAELGDLLRDERTLLGLSDAGAHANQLCDACYSTHLLGHWVRDHEALTLEQAVWRLSGQPAEVFGFTDRGAIKPGYVADLVAFDPDTVSPATRKRTRDMPGESERLVVTATGVEHVWVGGQAIISSGQAVADAIPGRLLRSYGPSEHPRGDMS